MVLLCSFNVVFNMCLKLPVVEAMHRIEALLWTLKPPRPYASDHTRLGLLLAWRFGERRPSTRFFDMLWSSMVDIWIIVDNIYSIYIYYMEYRSNSWRWPRPQPRISGFSLFSVLRTA